MHKNNIKIDWTVIVLEICIKDSERMIDKGHKQQQQQQRHIAQEKHFKKEPLTSLTCCLCIDFNATALLLHASHLAGDHVLACNRKSTNADMIDNTVLSYVL